MITKETKIVTREVTEDNVVIIRELVSIMENGEEIGHHFEQRNFKKGDDYSKEPAEVKAICAAVFK